VFCQKCGAQNDDSASYCTGCGTQIGVLPGPPPRPFEEDPAMRLLLPVGRSGWAIAAGYLGLFSVLLVFAPFALLCGILAIRDIKRNPKKCGMGRAIFGIVMGALGTVGLVFLCAAITSGSVR
jgi:hypothetical protein